MPEDLIVSDAVIHNSVVEGAKLSGAKRILCPHGDVEAIERALRLNRRRHRRAIVIVEGLYSMDGDVPDLAALIRLKRRYDSWLMVDEAHSLGVLGATGCGIAEEQAVDPTDIDIWMGTLSKALAATGGYIAGSRRLIELLKYTSPGICLQRWSFTSRYRCSSCCYHGYAAGDMASREAASKRACLCGRCQVTRPGYGS